MNKASMEAIFEGLLTAARAVNVDEKIAADMSGAMKDILGEMKEMNRKYGQQKEAVHSKLEKGARKTSNDLV